MHVLNCGANVGQNSLGSPNEGRPSPHCGLGTKKPVSTRIRAFSIYRNGDELLLVRSGVAMAIAAEYCITRRALEDRQLILINEFADETSRLVDLASLKNHDNFHRTLVRCAELRANIAESNRQLQIHQSQHRCRAVPID